LIEGYEAYYKYSLNGNFKDSINSESFFLIENPYTFKSNRDYYTTWFYDGDKTHKKIIQLFPEEDDVTIYYKTQDEFKLAYESILKNNTYMYQSGDTLWLRKDTRMHRINFKDKTIHIESLYENRDITKYKNKHLEFYNKSSFVRYANQGTYYYYYYKGDWYRLRGGGIDVDRKHYPEKLPPPRLKDIEIKRSPPAFVKQFYVPTQQHKGGDGLGEPQSFSTGFWVIHLGLPGGDTLVYRRLGDGLGNLSTFYQLPSSRGGNDSVLFISQEYNNQKGMDGGVYFTHGGLFMIRPKRK
jgi:hypothetical protein